MRFEDMLNTDLLFVLRWWFLLFIIGALFLPFTTKVFPRFLDRGYVFSKIIGIIVTSYIIFVLGFIHLLPFAQIGSWVVLLLLGVATLVLTTLKKHKQKYVTNFSESTGIFSNWKFFLLEEILFFLALFLWSYVRGFNPDIHGLEKYMDFGFVNSILRSTYFPPKDMWFTPDSINYYYFGHLATAVLTKLSGITSNITFNLMIATLFAFCFTASFSIGLNFLSVLKNKGNVRLKEIIAGLITAFLVTLAGNLHTIYLFFSPYPTDSPLPPWRLAFSPASFPNSYWYPNATRFIYHTIHEFPIYSFVVSDLHGHVLDIPVVLLAIAFLFSFFIRGAKEENKEEHEIFFKSLYKELLYFKKELIFTSFLVAIMYMTNAWDGLMYLLLGTLTFTTISILRTTTKDIATWERIFYTFFITLLSLGIVFYIFTLPFSIWFSPGSIVHGIGVLCAPTFLTNLSSIGPFLFEANHCQQSPWWQLLILYGFFYFWIFSFLFYLLKKVKMVTYLRIVIFATGILTLFIHPIFLFIWLATVIFLVIKNVDLQRTDLFILLLILMSVALIVIPEFFYMKDIYPDHYRANTMFKLVYQAFIMLSLVSGYVIVRIFTNVNIKKLLPKEKALYLPYIFISLVLLGLVNIYPYFAISSYYNNLQTYKGLDGTTYLSQAYPSDYAAINWLNSNIKGQPVILEAQGDSYTDYARVSTNTGLPTMLGWTVHEWLWRGSYSVPAPRITDVQTLYTTTDLQATQQLISKYNIQLVFIGYLEREKYPNLNEQKFSELGKVIYHNGNTTIYKINN